MRTIDKDGTWVINSGDFRIPLYTREETDLKFLEPGEVTKVKKDSFIEAQTTVHDVADPMAEQEAQAEGKTTVGKKAAK